ncbi:MAG: hypothetical protein JZD40_00090, partial [Sulfolobus sp.]|nr:hypothetical protein [Sulfolobus sp.]
MNTKPLLWIILLLLVISSITVVAHPESQQKIWSVQIWNISQMSESDYFLLASYGVNTVELQLYWGFIEPSPGNFTFSLLLQNINWIDEAGLNYILIFWYGPFDPYWITTYELGANGLPIGGSTPSPPWWNLTDMNCYIVYVNRTISLFLNDSHFLGAYVNYGWLDAFWYGGGYSKPDVEMFRNYLKSVFNNNITKLNEIWGTNYTNFSQIYPPTSYSQNPTAWFYFEE